MSPSPGRWPFGRLFLGGKRVDTLVQLRALAASCERDAERVALVRTLVRKYAGGLLAPWLKTQISPAALSACTQGSDGSPQAFTVLWETQDVDARDPVRTYRLLAEVAGFDEVFIERTVERALIDEVLASEVSVKRARCAQRSWFTAESDQLEGAWRNVATSDEELQGILARIAQERVRAGIPSVPEVVHLCRVDDEETFDLRGGRFPHTRFIGHGNPVAMLSRTRGSAPNVHLDLGDVPGMAFSRMTICASCALDTVPGQMQGCSVALREMG